MKIAIASDHAGYTLKEAIKKYLKRLKFEPEDFGTDSGSSVDFPDFASRVAFEISQKKFPFGILICGTGTGMAMVANRFKGVRAANCNTVFLAQLARAHNNANILTLGARILDFKTAKKIIRIFLKTKFEGGRHLRRIKKIHQHD
jgi:ribose 5-phosphate isomerase B